jgi:hypothetical protein
MSYCSEDIREILLRKEVRWTLYLPGVSDLFFFELDKGPYLQYRIPDYRMKRFLGSYRSNIASGMSHKLRETLIELPVVARRS